MLTRRILFGLAIALLATQTAVAQDDETVANKAIARATKKTTAAMMKTFASAELTEEQKASAVQIIENNIPALVQAQDALGSVLTEEQTANKKRAYDEAREEGLKGKKLQAAVDEALALTEEQKAQYTEAKASLKTVNNTIRTEIRALLTEEQVAAMPVKAGRAKGKGKGKRKGKGDGDGEENAKATDQAVSLKLPNMT